MTNRLTHFTFTKPDPKMDLERLTIGNELLDIYATHQAFFKDHKKEDQQMFDLMKIMFKENK